MEAQTIDTRNVIRKDNFIGVELNEGESVTISVEGKKIVELVVPYDCDLNCYVKRDSQPLQFRE